MSPRTAEKVKELAKKKVRRMRTDIIKEDDEESMEKLSKMLTMFRQDENIINE
jgi:U3 small nucleolar ribonucleoprotein component